MLFIKVILLYRKIFTAKYLINFLQAIFVEMKISLIKQEKLVVLVWIFIYELSVCVLRKWWDGRHLKTFLVVLLKRLFRIFFVFHTLALPWYEFYGINVLLLFFSLFYVCCDYLYMDYGLCSYIYIYMYHTSLKDQSVHFVSSKDVYIFIYLLFEKYTVAIKRA